MSSRRAFTVIVLAICGYHYQVGFSCERRLRRDVETVDNFVKGGLVLIVDELKSVGQGVGTSGSLCW